MKIITPTLIMLLLLGVPNIHAACVFSTTTATFAFGNLNTGNPIDVNISATLSFKCAGGPPGTMWTYAVTDDDGLYETGIDANRMTNATVSTQYLPYTFTYAPTSGTVPRNTNQTLTINGTIKGIDYQSASVGSYSDTVILSITP
mgnify:CR=1 FL=1